MSKRSENSYYLHLSSVGLAKILPYTAPVGENDEAVGVELVRELGPAPVLVDDGLDADERAGVRRHARHGHAAPATGDGEHAGAFLEERSYRLDLQYPISSMRVFLFIFHSRERERRNGGVRCGVSGASVRYASASVRRRWKRGSPKRKSTRTDAATLTPRGADWERPSGSTPRPAS